MIGYLLRRAGFYVLAAWVALTLNFFVPRLMPGDPATVMLARFRGQLDPESLDALRETFGLTDAPLWKQYITYLSHLFQGDLGLSVAYFPTPVSDVIMTGLVWTVFLAGLSSILAFGFGTLIGALAAWWRRGWLDSIAPPLMSLIGAFPYFWLAMAAAWLFGLELGWLPVRHAYNLGVEPGLNLAFISSVLQHALLPAGTMVLVSVGGWLLSMRNVMLGVLGDDFIAYARARGLDQRRVFIHYALRNAMLPNIAGFGMALGFVLSGALLTEIIFSYPGQGYLLIQAVRTQDYPLMQGIFLTITFAVLIANWMADLATAFLDPRTQ